jgi:hypothetical protein
MSKHRLALSIVLAVTLLVPGFSASLAQPVAAQPAPAASAAPGSMLIVENAGQWPEAARFQVWNSPLGAGTTWLAQDAIWLVVAGGRSPVAGGQQQVAGAQGFASPGADLPPATFHALKLTFHGSSPDVRIEPFQPADTAVNYFYGNDPAQWRPDVPVWHGVRYVDLYPGVDLVLGGEGQAWRLVAAPGAAVDQVRLRVEGSQSLVAERSRLILGIDDWATAVHLPAAAFAYQIDQWPSFSLSSAMPSVSGHQSSLQQTLPTNNPSALVFSTFIGGSLADSASRVVLDNANNIVVTGASESVDFPTTPGTFDPTHHGGICRNFPCKDGFVVKLDATGSAMIFATFVGGSDDDTTSAIAVDSTNHLYVTGFSKSADFPSTSGAFDPDFNGGLCVDQPCSDGFVARLSPLGDQLVFATFLGGSKSEWIASIAPDQHGNVILTGSTNSYDFPTTPDAFDQDFNGGVCAADQPCSDGFVSILDHSGSELLHSTFIGGSDSDTIYGGAYYLDESVFLVGSTGSEDFPATANAFDSHFNGGYLDAFVARYDLTAGNLHYATFLGGNREDYGLTIAVDRAGHAVVAGLTYSHGFPTTPHAFQTRYNDIFVTKLGPDGGDLVFSTFLGGNSDDVVEDLKLSDTGSIVVTASTYSTDFPTTSGAYATYKIGDTDAFVAVLQPSGAALEYGTYLGGSSYEWPSELALLGTNNVLVAGTTGSANFPSTPGAFSSAHNGGYRDVFITQIAITPYTADVIAQVDHPVIGTTVNGTVNIAGFAIDRGSGGWRTGIDQVHIYLDGPYSTGQIIGGAVYGLPSPDVAAQYGAQFRNSGWSLDWNTNSVAPGPHWLYIYARRTTDNAWSLLPPMVVVVAGGRTVWLPMMVRH